MSDSDIVLIGSLQLHLRGENGEKEVRYGSRIYQVIAAMQ